MNGLANRIESTAATLYTEEKKGEIERQLTLLLQNPHFSHSKRFPSFLRFIVREELAGRGNLLKERTLGVEVFGRDPGYDTTSDPIVRVTAAEIRKRIAQYYQEGVPREAVRISLPPGSYIPHFDWPAGESVRLETLPLATTAADPAPRPPTAVSPQPSPAELVAARWTAPDVRQLWFAAAGLCLILAIGAGYWFSRPHPTALDEFWEPVQRADTPVVVCFPRYQVETMPLRSADDPEAIRSFDETTHAVNIDDLGPLVSLTGLLETRHQRFDLLGQDAATLTDLRRGPAIFLGAFDNAWTLRVTRRLRYRFNDDSDMKHFWIEDTQGVHTHWEIDRNQQVSTNNYRDYAVVARFTDPSTGQIAVVSAGIARGGTVAAGEFLTHTANLQAIAGQLPRDWQSKNMEFVLSTEIIDGRSAPPRVEAVYFW